MSEWATRPGGALEPVVLQIGFPPLWTWVRFGACEDRSRCVCAVIPSTVGEVGPKQQTRTTGPRRMIVCFAPTSASSRDRTLSRPSSRF